MIDKKQNNNTYIEKVDYSVMQGCIVFSIAIAIIISFTIGFELRTILMEVLAGTVLGCLFIRHKIILKCPKCNEEIILIPEQINKINDIKSTCKCLKCNSEIIINTESKTFALKDIEENNVIVNNTNKIEDLYNLKVKGIITEEEFENKKKKLLEKL